MNAVAAPSSELKAKVVPAIISMGREVESMVNTAIDALLGLDQALAEAVLVRERVVNEMEMRIDADIVAALGEGNLGIEEIRLAMAMLKINKDLERLADLAVNIAGRIPAMSERGEGRHLPELQPIAIAVSHVVRKTLRALVHQDLVLAANVAASTSLVDSYRHYALHRLREKPRTESGLRPANVLLASRYLEQIGDHAGNVAESLLLWLDGRRVRIQAA